MQTPAPIYNPNFDAVDPYNHPAVIAKETEWQAKNENRIKPIAKNNGKSKVAPEFFNTTEAFNFT